MQKSFETYTEEILSKFKEIDGSAHRDIIIFYEHNLSHLVQLDLEAYLEVKVAYDMALFEIGRYEEFIQLCDELLEEVIYHNIMVLRGEDVFEKLLFKKSAAYYQKHKYLEAEEILWQLVRMNPKNAAAVYLLKRCRIKNQPSFIQRAKAVSIFLFLLAACTIAVELLFIIPFYESYSSQVEFLRILIFLAGIFILVLSDGWHRLKSFHDINQKVEQLREKV